MNRIVILLWVMGDMTHTKLEKLVSKGFFTRKEYTEFLRLLGWSEDCIEEVMSDSMKGMPWRKEGSRPRSLKKMSRSLKKVKP